jgi:hypothetical protein
MTFMRSVIIAIALWFAGCLEYHTTTTVREDGSILRTVVIRGDSTSTHRWDFVVPVDSSWSWERAKTGDREWTLTFRREFPSAEAFNVYQSALAGSILRSEISIERSFRWFTTVYRYREHLPSVNAFRYIPLSDYISPSDLEAFLRHEVQKEPFASPAESVAVENASDQFEAWARRNEFEALFGALKVGADRLAETSFSPESLYVRKRQLAEAYEALKDTGEVFDAKGLVRRRDEWLKRWREPVVRRAAAAAQDSLEGIEAKMRTMHRLMEFPHKTSVVMPGLMTTSNARSIDGASAKWEDYLIVLYFQDFTFEAESAVTHWWAVAVTGLLAFGLPAGWYVWRRRKG